MPLSYATLLMMTDRAGKNWSFIDLPRGHP
jgi:hypothetical protein